MNALTNVESTAARPSTAERAARGLGWFSIALGLAELARPRRFAITYGLEGKETLIRAFGAREVGAGLWALSGNQQAAMWARFAGDFADLAMLGLGYRSGGKLQQRNALIAMAAVAGVAATDLAVALALGKKGRVATA